MSSMLPVSLQARPMPSASSAQKGDETQLIVEHILPQFMQTQQQSNWCWAAVSSSVGLFLQTGSWTQCGVASHFFPGQNCCSNPGPCNQVGYLDLALTYTCSLLLMLEQSCDVKKVMAYLDQSYPFGVRIQWPNNGGGHFNVISGYFCDAANPQAVSIVIQDPLYGTTQMNFNDFPIKYQGGATWTHSYLTKPMVM